MNLETVFRNLIALLFSALVLFGCSPKQEPKVVATVGMIADLAKTIAADCAEVEAVMGPGIDPHLYKPSASDVQLLQNAILIFYSGYHLEGQMGEVLAKLEETRPVVAVAETAISEADTLRSNGSAVDPHLWMDVGLWRQTIDTISGALVALKPDCAAAMQTRAGTLKTELEALDGWVAASVASIPEEQRVLVTAHDAFAYYGRAYDIQVEGIQGISTASEASLADIRNTVDTVVERQVPALFIESSINPRTIEAVQAAVNDRGFDVNIGDPLYSDAMGENGSSDGTYIGMLRRNTLNIVTALGGEVAPWPAALDDWAERWQL